MKSLMKHTAYKERALMKQTAYGALMKQTAYTESSDETNSLQREL